MALEKILTRIINFLFIRYFVRKAASRLRNNLPRLAMTENQSIVIASPAKNAGQIRLSGFGTPRFRYDVFIADADGFKAVAMEVYVNRRNRLDMKTEKGLENLSFTDVRCRPIVEFLKTIWAVFPYTLYMAKTEEELATLVAPRAG